jgi:hypothetical protein
MEEEALSPLGWALLIVSWGAITLLMVYCFWRVFYPGRRGEKRS